MLFLHQIFNSVWMIDADYAANYIPLVTSYLKGSSVKQSSPTPSGEYNANNGVVFATPKNGIYQISDAGCYASPEKAPVDSIAIISISGAITKHDQDCGPSGMQTKANLLERCYANDNIEGVIIRVDSGGGEGGAMRLFNETVARRNKAVVGFIDDYACSAAYGIISGADMIIANSNEARIGSIGTYLTILDYSKKLEMEGINVIEVYASASTDKNREYFEALKGNTDPLKEIADRYNEGFLSQIEKQRGENLQSDRKVWGTGKVFFADKALEIGLISAIDSFDNILNYFNT